MGAANAINRVLGRKIKPILKQPKPGLLGQLTENQRKAMKLAA